MDNTSSNTDVKPKRTKKKNKVVKPAAAAGDVEDAEDYEEVLSYSAGKEIPTKKGQGLQVLSILAYI